MPTEYDDFQTAYREWKAATEKYEARISEIIHGAATNDATMAEIIKDMASKHAVFMQSATPFVNWK